MRSLLMLALGVICALIAQAPPAQAQSFISGTGKDTNICSRIAPCRTLQRGVNATSPGRELTILTSGEYGRATIEKGMTILAEGVSANIRSFASGSAAITIDAPGQKVALKGLFLTGGHAGSIGVDIVAAAAVHIDDCVVERFGDTGIRMNSSAGTELFVSDTVSRYNYYGLRACCGSSRLTVDNSRFENNGDYGLLVETGQGSVTRSLASDNAGIGIYLNATGGSLNVTSATAANNFEGFVPSVGQLTLSSVVASGNGRAGLFVAVGGTAIVTDSVFTNNDTGIFNFGELSTRGNNVLAGNTTSFNGDNAAMTLAPTRPARVAKAMAARDCRELDQSCGASA
jgi:hypothetical protein